MEDIRSKGLRQILDILNICVFMWSRSSFIVHVHRDVRLFAYYQYKTCNDNTLHFTIVLWIVKAVSYKHIALNCELDTEMNIWKCIGEMWHALSYTLLPSHFSYSIPLYPMLLELEYLKPEPKLLNCIPKCFIQNLKNDETNKIFTSKKKIPFRIHSCVHVTWWTMNVEHLIKKIISTQIRRMQNATDCEALQARSFTVSRLRHVYFIFLTECFFLQQL